MAYYDFKKKPALTTKEGEKDVLYPSIVFNGTINTKQLLKQLVARTGYKPGVVEGTLMELVDLVGEYIGQGYRVEVGEFGYFSGKIKSRLVKDKKEYFALAAGDHVEGMEPFADVQKRMERAIGLLAATGHQAVAAVSHGAAINVLLAGLTNHEIGTGKTRLYNGAINVIEGSQTGGFHVLHCNLPPDDPKTRQILLQDR